MIDLLDEAQRRYLTDAVFQARAERVRQALDADLHAKTGAHLNSEDRHLVVLAAAAGLLMAERDPVNL